MEWYGVDSGGPKWPIGSAKLTGEREAAHNTVTKRKSVRWLVLRNVEIMGMSMLNGRG